MKKIFLFTCLLLINNFCLANDVILLAGQSNAVALDSSAFKVKYETLTGRTVDVINCAVGGTYIIQHAQEFSSLASATPVTDCRYKAQVQRGKGHIIKGVIFWQGESDTIKLASRTAQFQTAYPIDWLKYFQNMQKIIREGLNQLDLPFVVIKLPSYRANCFPSTVEPIFYTAIKDLQVTAGMLPSTTTLNIDDIYYDCQSVHLANQAGIYSEIARRAAEEWVRGFN